MNNRVYYQEQLDRTKQVLITQSAYLTQDFETHIHKDFYEIVVILQGYATHVINSQEYSIKTGDVYILGENTSHAFRDVDNLKILNIMLLPQLLKEYERIFTPLEGYHMLFNIQPSIRKDNKLCSILNTNTSQLSNIITLYNDMNTNKTKPSSYTYFVELVLLLSRIIEKQNLDQDKTMIIASIATYIENNYDSNIKLSDIYEKFPMSPRQIQRLFIQYYKVSVSDFLMQTRLRHAKELLSSSMPITKVAYLTGFCDSNYFARMFNKNVGISPSEYKKKINIK